MKAMILAAGRGERMMPLTENLPKPMLQVAGKPLMQYHIEKLAAAGITDIVINHAWCGEKIKAYFSTGEKFAVNITYSDESAGALETAGGIIKALPLLTDSENDVFLVINGDVFVDFGFTSLPELSQQCLAHLWLADNPPQHPNGDFYLEQGLVSNQGELANKFTFAGISLYRRQFFSQLNTEQPLALGPLLRKAATQGKISGSKLIGDWADIGTPQRLALLEQQLEQKLAQKHLPQHNNLIVKERS